MSYLQRLLENLESRIRDSFTSPVTYEDEKKLILDYTKAFFPENTQVEALLENHIEYTKSNIFNEGFIPKSETALKITAGAPPTPFMDVLYEALKKKGAQNSSQLEYLEGLLKLHSMVKADMKLKLTPKDLEFKVQSHSAEINLPFLPDETRAVVLDSVKVGILVEELR